MATPAPSKTAASATLLSASSKGRNHTKRAFENIECRPCLRLAWRIPHRRKHDIAGIIERQTLRHIPVLAAQFRQCAASGFE